MLPDFPDSKVSAPLYQPEGQGGGEGQDKESVRPTTELPQTEIQDEALRTQFRDDSHIKRAPQWLEVADAIMEEHMSEEETDWKVRDWLAKTLQPQDTGSVRGKHEEPMVRANHCASD